MAVVLTPFRTLNGADLKSTERVYVSVRCVVVGSIELQCEQQQQQQQQQQAASGVVTQTIDVTDTSSTYLSSYITQQTSCGSFDSPWRLVAPAGRRLAVYLLDFATHDAAHSATSTCQVAGALVSVSAIYVQDQFSLFSQIVQAKTVK